MCECVYNNLFTIVYCYLTLYILNLEIYMTARRYKVSKTVYTTLYAFKIVCNSYTLYLILVPALQQDYDRQVILVL